MTQDSGDEPGERQDRYQRAAAAAAGAAAGAVIAGPVGAIAGAALGPLLEPLARKVWEEISSDGQRRAGEVLASAMEASGRSEHDLDQLIDTSDQTRLLAGLAISAGTRTSWQAKVRTLGRSLASGLLAEDDAKIDTEQLIPSALADIEAPHLSLLDLLVTYEPGTAMGGPAFQQAVHPVRRNWRTAQICRARPALQPVVASLLGTLQRHGLIAQSDNVAEALQNYSRTVSGQVAHLQQQTRSRNPRPVRSPMRPLNPMEVQRMAPEPSWSPTELGDLVHRRFREAGAEIPDEWTTTPEPPTTEPPP